MQVTTTSQKAYILRSKCYCMNTAKIYKFFLNLQKQREAQNAIKKLIDDDKETTNQTNFLEYEGVHLTLSPHIFPSK